MTTGREIREARQLAGLTQQALAKLVGVSQRTVGNWERGDTVPQRHEAVIWSVLDPKLDSASEFDGVTMNDFSDAALLAEIARRFDLTRSKRALEEARNLSEQEPSGIAIGPGMAALIPTAGSSQRPEWHPNASDLVEAARNKRPEELSRDEAASLVDLLAALDVTDSERVELANFRVALELQLGRLEAVRQKRLRADLPVEGDAQPDGITSGDDGERDAFGLAADHGTSARARLDADAQRRGEESQDSGAVEPA